MPFCLGAVASPYADPIELQLPDLPRRSLPERNSLLPNRYSTLTGSASGGKK